VQEKRQPLKPQGKLAWWIAIPAWKESEMRLLSAVLAASLVFLPVHSARAFGPRRIGAYNKQAAIGAYGRAVYPKYYWGFHAREFQNVGVPHGDIGILGSGLSRDPW
jgi:hypothetical protein